MKRMMSALVVGLVLAGPATAQDAASLADIRQEAAVLSVEIARLKQELNTTGLPNTQFAGGSTLERVDLMEAALTRLTSKVEELEFRINQVVRDGTNQLDDINFRLCEMEEGCDIGNLPPLAPLGGEAVGGPVIAPVTGDVPMDGDGELALAEQSDYDAALALYDAGDYAAAAAAFSSFATTYTGGYLTGEAHFMRGESLQKQGDIAGAARAYLDSFSGAPEGDRAPSALLRLGTALAALGQVDKGCVMLSEVGARFGGAPEASEAAQARSNLGCQ